ncbi:hypothetical protein D3C71_2173020 [compost metagenome]
MLRQQVDRHQMAIGSTEDRHLFALEILDFFEIGSFGNGQVKIGAHPQCGQQFGVQSVGAPDDGG